MIDPRFLSLPLKHSLSPEAIPLQVTCAMAHAAPDPPIMSASPDPAALDALHALARRALCGRHDRLTVLGLSGAQGSGKSTLAAALRQRLDAEGVPTAILSLDDLYLTRADRLRLGAEVHPLLATRGVPGTHDVALGLATIAALERGEPALLPRFDKARDDRRAPTEADRAPARTRLLVFEGWCIGARPQTEAALAEPMNALEAEEDRAGVWRHTVNAALAGPYAALWARIDALAMLRAPDFATIVGWRQQQERALRKDVGDCPGLAGPGVMTDSAVTRFVAHYERITRHLLADLPGRADCIIDLAPDRHVTRIAMAPDSGPPVE